jgi:perosamine synthetase
MIPISKPMMGPEEEAAVIEVLRSGHLAQGERVEEFEQRFAAYIGAPYSVAVNNGTSALHLTLLAMGIHSGDEIITTPLSFIATAGAIALAGAEPVFVDVWEGDFLIDEDLVEAAITPRTRAILPVSLYGQPADMNHLALLAEQNGLLLLEDASQAVGAERADRMSGTWGSGGTFSFYATKNMTTGEGGMLTTGDRVLAERVRLLRSHGERERYRSERLGFNARMTDIQAAIGLAQLTKLPDFIRRRREIAHRYSAEMKGVITPDENGFHVYHQYVIRVPRREEFIRRLLILGVQTGIHYPIPLHQQKPFEHFEIFPVTEKLCGEILSIPVHPGLSDEDVSTVIGAVNQVAAELA